MVARRVCEHTFRVKLLIQPGNTVIGTSEFEGARALETLELYEDASSDKLIDSRWLPSEAPRFVSRSLDTLPWIRDRYPWINLNSWIHFGKTSRFLD